MRKSRDIDLITNVNKIYISMHYKIITFGTKKISISFQPIGLKRGHESIDYM